MDIDDTAHDAAQGDQGDRRIIDALERLERRLTRTSRIYRSTLEIADDLYPMVSADVDAEAVQL